MEPYGLEVADEKDPASDMLLGGPKDIECLLGETGLDVLFGDPDADRLGGDPGGVSRGVLVCDANNRPGGIRGLGTSVTGSS